MLKNNKTISIPPEPPGYNLLIEPQQVVWTYPPNYDRKIFGCPILIDPTSPPESWRFVDSEGHPLMLVSHVEEAV